MMGFCPCQVRNKKNYFFKNIGEPLARFPNITSFRYNALLTLPLFNVKVIKVPFDFYMLVIVYEHISSGLYLNAFSTAHPYNLSTHLQDM